MEEAEKKGLAFRSLRYWGKNAEKTVAMILGFTLVYGIFLTAAWNHDGTQRAVEMLPGYLAMLGLMMIPITQVTNATISIPIVLSFGSKRNEVLWGVQWMNLLVNAQVVILFLLLRELWGGVTLTVMIGALLFALIFVTGMGQIGAAAMIKHGTRGAILAFLVLTAAVMGAGTAIVASNVFSNQGGILSFLGRRLGEDTGMALFAACGLTAVITYAGSVLYMKSALKKYEVRI